MIHRFLRILLTLFPFLLSAAEPLTLVDASGMNDGKFWKSFGETCSREKSGEECVLSLKKSVRNAVCSWRAGSLLSSAQSAAGPFTLSFQAELQDIVPGRKDDVWAGFVVMLHGHRDGKYINLKTTRILPDGTGYRPHVIRGSLPRGLTDLYLEFFLQRASGTVNIKDVSLTVTPMDGAQKAITVKVVGGRTVELYPVPRHPVSKAPLRTREKDFVFFDGTNTRQIYDTTIPESSELIEKAAGYGTRGELRRIFTAVHALRDLNLKSIRISDLESASGSRISASQVEIFRVHNWPQGDGMGRTLTYSVVPEVLLPFQGISLRRGSSANFMIRVRIPENAAPEIYSGALRFQADGAEKVLELKLRVLPFTLIRPANETMTYLVHVGSFGENVEEAVEACREFKDRGVEGLVVACQYGKGMLQLEKGPDGSPRIRSFGKLDQALAGYRAAKMTGPLILHFSDQLEIAVARAMGFDLPRGHEAGGVNAAMKTPEFSQAMQQVFAELKKRCAGCDLYIMCIDEPGGYADRRERALWECREIQKAGLKASVYQFGEFWKQLKELCRLQIFTSTPVPGQTRTETAEEVKRAGVKPYAYGIHGSYEGAPCGIMPNRARSGFLAHEEGFAGQTLWLYAPGKPMDFNGTEQLRFFPLLKYRAKDGKLVSTLQWEGLCEGICDYAYLNTLDQLLAAGGKNEKAREIAERYALLRRNLAKQIIPTERDEKSVARFSNRTADAVRWQIAQWIMELNRKESGK